MFKSLELNSIARYTRIGAFAGSVAILSLSSTMANAACKGVGCACKPSELQFASPVAKPNEDGQFAIALEADNMSADGDDVVTLIGNAEVSQGRQTIVADKLQYYRETERVVASGNVEVISAKGDYLSGDSVDVTVPTQIGTLTNSNFKLAKKLSSKEGIDTVQIDSRGSAAEVNLEGEGLVRLKDARYTNCPEGNDSVMVSAKELELDRLGGIGRARGATIRFQGLPIFYAPYITFPINDERKTGFLTPGFGSDEDSGNVFEFPWYWNIAKNQDATITPRYFTDRGVQLAAEYRHKSATSETYLFGEYLPSDDLFGDDRDLITIQHSQEFNDNWSTQINYNDVSDADYFDDLRNDSRLFSATFVPRDAQINYGNDYFRVQTRANEYQIIDPDIPLISAPYERLPSITFTSNLPDGPYDIEYGISASYTDFASDERVEGTRTALNPYIEKTFENLWGYIKPELSVHHRSYSLDNVLPGNEEDPSFTVPILSIDAGIYLEKNIKWFGESALQTLEPRIFYAYAPEEDQSDVPLFDTRQVQFNNLSNIYRANRFFGQDRVGDTNQVTLGLTSRIIDNDTGRERVKISVGQLYLLDDLEQNIVNGAVIESGLGDFLAEAQTRSGAWTTRTFIQYDHEESEIRSALFRLAYRPREDNRKRIGINYLFSKRSVNDVDQVRLDVNWPISDRWQFFGETRYSFEDSESLFTNAGLEYSSCCWKVRFSAQDRISNRNIDDKKTSFFVELELTALGKVRTGL